MGYLLADFVIDTGACVRYSGSTHIQYPARPADHDDGRDDWPCRCTWIVLPANFDVDIDSRIQALLSSTTQTTTIAVHAVQSDGSSDHWTASPKWPEAVAIIESVELRCLRADILSCSLQSEADLRLKIESLIYNVYSFHRHGIAHGNIHSLTVRINEATTFLPPILIGDHCLDIYHDYCPPEHLLLSDHTPTMPGDIWSLACAIIEILSGQSIFFGVDPGQILQRQQSQLSISVHERYLNFINRVKGNGDDRDLAKLLTSMLSEDMNERPTISTIMDMMSLVIDVDRSRFIQVQPNPKPVMRTEPILCGRTEAWWRKPVGAQSSAAIGSAAVNPINGCDSNFETINIDIGRWCNNELNSISSRLVVCLQLGNQTFRSKSFAYPTKSLNVSHRFLMKRDEMIATCSSHPLLIRLMAIRDLVPSNQQVSVRLGMAEVDLRPLLAGFPHIEGYYQVDPANVGQIAVQVRPMNSLDQRDLGPAGRSPTWSLFNSFLLSN